VIPRTTGSFTSTFMPDGGNITPLASFHGLHIDGLCRRTKSPGTGGGESGPRYGAEVTSAGFTLGGESESKIIVWTEAGDLSFRGANGPRKNVPAGQPNYGSDASGTPPFGKGAPNANNGMSRTTRDATNGEGEHMFVGATNEVPDEDHPTANGYPGFNSGAGFIGTSQGASAVGSMMTGFDVLGVGNQCVYAGVLTLL
jgi:hypothetical protein